MAVLLLSALMLSGCGGSTPLTHALAAFRDGDHDDFLAAKVEADEAVKHAIQPGDDLCMMTAMDIERYGTVAAIAELDRPEIWKLDDEARLAYALKIAGKHLVIEPGSFLSQAPLYTAATGQGNQITCVGERDKMMANMALNGSQASDADEARMDLLHDWIRALKNKDGDNFETHMHSAVATLDNAGYSAKWPAEVDFIE